MVSRSEGDSIAVRACVSRAASACHADQAVPPPACPRSLWPSTARIRGHGLVGASPPRMSWRADGSGGVCPGSGGHGLGAPWVVGLRLLSPRHPPPSSVFAIRGPGFGLRLSQRVPAQKPGGWSPNTPAAAPIGRWSRRHLRLRFC